MKTHNHGSEDGPGLACREYGIEGRLVGECILRERQLVSEATDRAYAMQEDAPEVAALIARLANALSQRGAPEVTDANAYGLLSQAVKRASEMLDCHGCITGDCPHSRWGDCESALIADVSRAILDDPAYSASLRAAFGTTPTGRRAPFEATIQTEQRLVNAHCIPANHVWTVPNGLDHPKDGQDCGCGEKQWLPVAASGQAETPTVHGGHSTMCRYLARHKRNDAKEARYTAAAYGHGEEGRGTNLQRAHHLDAEANGLDEIADYIDAHINDVGTRIVSEQEALRAVENYEGRAHSLPRRARMRLVLQELLDSPLPDAGSTPIHQPSPSEASK